jgi:hypothetical protein
MSVRLGTLGRSTSATGLCGSFQTLRARRKIPLSSTTILRMLRRESLPAHSNRETQSSIDSVVMSSSGCLPKVGSRCARTTDR